MSATSSRSPARAPRASRRAPAAGAGHRLGLFLAVGLLAGCEDDALGPVDAGATPADASASPTDAAAPTDGGPSTDAGLSADASAPADGGAPPTDRTVGQIDLPPVELDPDGNSPDIAFELPQGTTSFMIIVEGAAPANYIVRRLTDAGGTQIVTDEPVSLTPIERFTLGEFASQFKSPNRVIQDVAVSAALFPNNPGVSVSGGRYTLVVSGVVPPQGPATGEIRVRVLHRTGEPSSGVLPVTLYFSGAGGIDAAGGPTDPLVVGALDAMRGIYMQANVRIGEVRYRDVDARFRTIPLALDGSPGLLEEMFALTAGEGPGLHFFFVDRFEGGLPGAMVAGVSGGLPGPARAVGTVNSGVAVALSSAGQDASTLAHVMAHEGGHWLGLFHTSEITGTEDQHPETPSGQAGQNHLMYPAVGGGTTLSPSQSAVLRRHMETIAE